MIFQVLVRLSNMDLGVLPPEGQIFEKGHLLDDVDDFQKFELHVLNIVSPLEPVFGYFGFEIRILRKKRSRGQPLRFANLNICPIPSVNNPLLLKFHELSVFWS